MYFLINSPFEQGDLGLASWRFHTGRQPYPQSGGWSRTNVILGSKPSARPLGYTAIIDQVGVEPTSPGLQPGATPHQLPAIWSGREDSIPTSPPLLKGGVLELKLLPESGGWIRTNT